MTPTPEDLAAFPNRYAVEREIEAAENPTPGTMHLNDGHERVRLPGGTLRRMLAVIDQLAAMASSAQQGEPVAAWLNKFMPVVAQLDGIELVRRSDAVAAINARPTAPAEPAEACRNDGRCQYAIDHGADGLAHCPTGKCCMPAALQAHDTTKGE